MLRGETPAGEHGDGLLPGGVGRQEVIVRHVLRDVDVDGLEDEGGAVDVELHVGDGPVIVPDVLVRERDGAAFLESGDDSPADADTVNQVSMEFDEVEGRLIDPDCAVDGGADAGFNVRRGVVRGGDEGLGQQGANRDRLVSRRGGEEGVRRSLNEAGCGGMVRTRGGSRAGRTGRCGSSSCRSSGQDRAVVDLDVLFLGTAGSAPTAQRGLPATLVRLGGEDQSFTCADVRGAAGARPGGWLARGGPLSCCARSP